MINRVIIRGYRIFRVFEFCPNPGTNIVVGQLLNRTAEFAPAEGTIDFISSFGEDSVGNLYILTLGGDVFRIVPDTSPIPALTWWPLAMLVVSLAFIAALHEQGTRSRRKANTVE